MKINGNKLLKDASKALQIDLVKLIAATAIWAHPDTVSALKQDSEDNINGLWVKNCRRLKNNEQRRQFGIDGCYLDDNTFANKAIKSATGGVVEQGTFTACHIYDESCYNKNYHTAIPNLVLIPKSIYSLTDNDKDVIDALKYRSYELYSFYINTVPNKPLNYDSIEWLKPMPFSDKVKKTIQGRKRTEFINMDLA